MSTFTAVGPALDLDGPLPVAPEHSLLETRIRRRTEDGGFAFRSVIVERDPTRVLNGVNVWGYPTGCSELWEPCSDGTYRTKSEESEQPTPRFDAFVVYKPIQCSGIGLDNAYAAELNERISMVLDATASASVEQALAQGIDGSNNPFVGDTNVSDLTPTPGTAVSPGVGLSILENAVGSTCREGMIGATPATIAALQAFPINTGDTMNRLITANGTPVYSADGLIDVDTADLPATTGTEDWMIAHGPVNVYMGPTVTQNVRSSLDRSDNSLVFRAERYVLAIWDTALQAAVLVDWAS
jgi:hypothetical protein